MTKQNPSKFPGIMRVELLIPDGPDTVTSLVSYLMQRY